MIDPNVVVKNAESADSYITEKIVDTNIFHKGCSDCKDDSDYRNRISECLILNKKYGNDFINSVTCSHGCYYFDKVLFYKWSITPSSEDKGFCTY